MEALWVPKWSLWDGACAPNGRAGAGLGSPKPPYICPIPLPPSTTSFEKSPKYLGFPLGRVGRAHAHSPYILYTSNAVCSRPRWDSPLKRGCTLQKAGQKRCQEIIRSYPKRLLAKKPRWVGVARRKDPKKHPFFAILTPCSLH